MIHIHAKRAAGLLLLVLMANGALAAEARIPRLANGRPDFSGIWQTTSAAEFDLEPHSARPGTPPGAGVIDGGALPYLPSALAQRKKNFEKRAKEDPRLKCWTL